MMSEMPIKNAAQLLARQLSLPPSRAYVFVWDNGIEQMLMLRGDTAWLARHCQVPKDFMGYKVTVDGYAMPVAYQ